MGVGIGPLAKEPEGVHDAGSGKEGAEHESGRVVWLDFGGLHGPELKVFRKGLPELTSQERVKVVRCSVG